MLGSHKEPKFLKTILRLSHELTDIFSPHPQDRTTVDPIHLPF
jgi:hypothetical protein